MLQDAYLGTWDDGTKGAFALFACENIYLEFVSFISEGELFLQLCVYEYEE